MCMSKEAQSFSWRTSLPGFSLMPQSLPSWAKVVPSIVLQGFCPSHDPKQRCLMEDNAKLCALIPLWEILSQVTGLVPVKFNWKTAYSKIQVGYHGLLESHRACQTLELQLLQFAWNTYLWKDGQTKCLEFIKEQSSSLLTFEVHTQYPTPSGIVWRVRYTRFFHMWDDTFVTV